MAPIEPSAPPRPEPRFRGSVPPRRFRGNVLAPLALAALLGGCGLVPEPAPDYLVDSGYRVAPRYVYWLDAHRIIFQGSRPDKPLPPPYRTAINIWDTRTGEMEEYKRVTGRTQLCYADGWISYLPDRTRVPFSEGTRRLHWGGPMGEEEWLNPGSKPGHRLHWNRHSCRFQHLKVEESGFIRGHPLRIGDGRLVTSGRSKDSNTPIKWLDDNGNLLQILDHVTCSKPQYYQHLQGYLFSVLVGTDEAHQQWQETGCLYVHVLRIGKTKASVDELCVPWGNIRATSSLQVIPLHKGFYVFGESLEPGKGNRGGYLVTQSKAIMLFSGQLSGLPAISTDGCRIAVAPQSIASEPLTLKYADVCKLMEEFGNDDNRDDAGRRT